MNGFNLIGLNVSPSLGEKPPADQATAALVGSQVVAQETLPETDGKTNGHNAQVEGVTQETVLDPEDYRTLATSAPVRTAATEIRRARTGRRWDIGIGSSHGYRPHVEIKES